MAGARTKPYRAGIPLDDRPDRNQRPLRAVSCRVTVLLNRCHVSAANGASPILPTALAGPHRAGGGGAAGGCWTHEHEGRAGEEGEETLVYKRLARSVDGRNWAVR